MFGYRSRFLRVMVLWASTRYTTGSRSFAGTVGDLLARRRSPPSIPVKAEVTVLPNVLERSEDMVDEEELGEEDVETKDERVRQSADRLEGIQ